MPVYVKMMSSWVRKVLGITKAHIAPGTFCGALVLAAYAAGVSLVSILEASDWARVSTPTRHYFSNYITTTNQHSDSI